MGTPRGKPLKGNVLVSSLALRVVEWVVALVDPLGGFRGLSRLDAVAVFGRPEEPERGDDHFRHIALLPFTILVTA